MRYCILASTFKVNKLILNKPKDTDHWLDKLIWAVYIQ